MGAEGAVGAPGPAPPARPKLSRERLGGLASAGSAAVGLGAVFGALAVSPWFVWTQDALSDLGHPSHESAPIFNTGLAAAGLLYLAFVWGLERVAPTTAAGTATLLILAAGGASLAAIGVMNESWGPAHFTVSLTYFTFVPLGMALFAWSLLPRRRLFAAATFATALAAGAFGISILTAIAYEAPFTSQAVPELVASALLAGWSVLAGFDLLRHPAKPEGRT